MTSTSLDDAPFTGFHKRLAGYASGGAFMQGYVLSITGVAMVQIAPQLNLDPLQQGLVVGSALIGGLPGAYFDADPAAAEAWLTPITFPAARHGGSG